MLVIIVILTAIIGFFVEDIAKGFQRCWERKGFRHSFVMFWLTFCLAAFHIQVKAACLWLLVSYRDLLLLVMHGLPFLAKQALLTHLLVLAAITGLVTALICGLQWLVWQRYRFLPANLFLGLWLFLMALTF